jgi:hypothetical protein
MNTINNKIKILFLHRCCTSGKALLRKWLDDNNIDANNVWITSFDLLRVSKLGLDKKYNFNILRIQDGKESFVVYENKLIELGVE